MTRLWSIVTEVWWLGSGVGLRSPEWGTQRRKLTSSQWSTSEAKRLSALRMHCKSGSLLTDSHRQTTNSTHLSMIRDQSDGNGCRDSARRRRDSTHPLFTHLRNIFNKFDRLSHRSVDSSRVCLDHLCLYLWFVCQSSHWPTVAYITFGFCPTLCPMP